MALHRVRSRTHGYESIQSDEWLERYPEDFDVIDDEPLERVTADSRRPATESLPKLAPDDADEFRPGYNR